MKTGPFFVLMTVSLALLLLGACSAPPPTATAVPPTAVSIQPTATTVPPTATATATSLPPTAKSLPPTATNTSVPPTATNTAVPPTRTNTPTTIPPTATATATSRPPTATKVPATATRKPTLQPTAKPVAAGAFTVTWKTGIEYLSRDATSFWCQTHNQFQNQTDAAMPFQDFKDESKKLIHLLTLNPTDSLGGYQPVVGIYNGDGTLNHWQSAGWYAKAFGWRNGIEQFPPDPLAARADSGDWTWYGVPEQGQYCRYVYMRWKGQVSAAEYSPDGKLINTNATLPAGAP